MREPIKPGTNAGKSRESCALGNIDEETGQPGKGAGGAHTLTRYGGGSWSSTVSGGERAGRRRHITLRPAVTSECG